MSAKQPSRRGDTCRSTGSCKSILDEVEAAPDRWTYTDLAIAPPKDDEFEALDLYKQTAGSDAALARKRRSDEIREKTSHTPKLEATG